MRPNSAPRPKISAGFAVTAARALFPTEGQYLAEAGRAIDGERNATAGEVSREHFAARGREQAEIAVGHRC